MPTTSPYLPDPYAVAPSRAEAGRLRIATLNVFAQHGDWATRRPVLVDGFRRLGPDLVALQEVVRTDTYDQAADLLGDGYHIVHQTEGRVDENAIAIASRWPIAATHEVDLHLTPRTATFSCTALIAEIAAPDPVGELIVVNHFPSYEPPYEHERELQAVVVAHAIETLVAERPRHVILAGDLDADPEAASIRFWTGRQSLDGLSVCYRDAWESAHPGEAGHTFTPENALMAAATWDWPFRRIDYILVRCGERGQPTLSISACERIFDQPVDGVWGSDHFGVMVDLALPPRRGTPA